MKEAYAARRLSWLQPRRRQRYWLLLYVWGAQWMVAAAGEALPAVHTAELVRRLSLLAALVLSAAVLWSAWRRDGAARGAGDARGSAQAQDEHAGGSRGLDAGRGADDARESASGTGELDGVTAGRSLGLLWPWVFLPSVVLLLQNTGALTPLVSPVLGACLLACAYMAWGRLLGQPLLWLGVWLLVLTVVVAIGYWGYAGVVLEGMSGISLLACGWMLRFWGNAAG